MKIVIIIISILIHSSAFFQNPNSQKKYTPKEFSIKQINDLKNGVLLVRLKTKNSTITALRDHGHFDKANEFEDDLLDFNLSLIKAFNSNFDFCKFYFFSSDYSTFIRNKQFDSIYFFNEDMEIDKSMQAEIDIFFIAEYGPVEADTMTYYQGTYATQGEDGLEKRDAYSGSGSFGFEALIIKNDQFYQLAQPFPYYVRTWDSSRKPNKVVKKLNTKLKDYFESVAK